LCASSSWKPMPRSTRVATRAARRCGYGHAAGVCFLVTEGNAALEYRWYGNTSLLRDAHYGHLDAVGILLLAGADVAACLLAPRVHLANLTTNVLVAVVAAAYDAVGAAATLIAALVTSPSTTHAVRWERAAAQAQEAWLTYALDRALRGKHTLTAPCRLSLQFPSSSSSSLVPDPLPALPFRHPRRGARHPARGDRAPRRATASWRWRCGRLARHLNFARYRPSCAST
jgi:hypothetical protein